MSYAVLNRVEILDDTLTSLNHSQARNRTAAAPLNILLVEDDASDVMLTEVALDNVNVEYDLHTLDNGAEVLPYLRHRGKYQDEHKPDVMLLDLSLPNQDGFEVLAEMVAQAERFGSIPIVILTGDHDSAFLRQSHDLNIVAYVTKPCSADKMRRVFGSLRKQSK